MLIVEPLKRGKTILKNSEIHRFLCRIAHVQIISKVLKNSFFKLLARSWFWQMLFSIQNCKLKSIEKNVFLAFGKILVLVNAFLHQNLHQNHVLLSFLFGLGHGLLFK